MTVYAYVRVSTEGKGQTTDNQKKLISEASFAVDKYFSEDGVSGSIKATERPEFSKMLSILKDGDTIIVTMVDRLGRSASDILNVVEHLKTLGIKLRVLQFDGMDITSSMGKMVLTCMAAMAELERNILIERTKAGIERSKFQGTKFGAPLTITPEQLNNMCNRKNSGATYDQLAKEFGAPRMTIARNVAKWNGKMGEYAKEYSVRQAQYEGKRLAAV